MVSSILSINQSIIIQHAGHNAGYNSNKYLFASKTFCDGQRQITTHLPECSALAL